LLYVLGVIPKDDVQEAVWFQRAADQGLASAQGWLGDDYHYGRGVPQDFKKAANWYRKAADQGVVDAQYNLARQYAEGEGVPQDYAEAYFWLELAAGGQKSRDRARYAKDRDAVSSKLTPHLLSETQRRANKWQAEHFGK
jgi:uncharacterized protein